MARIRSAKPDYWTDPLMCSLPRDIRSTFKGIWEVCADDHGRFLADARIIKGDVWPLDDDISLKKIEAWLNVLADSGRIQLYFVHGVRYGFVRNWLKHQRVSHPSPSRFPEPPSENLRSHSGAIPESLASDSVLSGAERRGVERNRSGAEEIGRAAIREDTEEPLPRVVLPAKADAFLNMFYPARGEAERERRLNVRKQLYETIDPLHPGPKIRGGMRCKARSTKHLEDCLDAVMKDPPMDGDMAIVFVLKKLTDRPKGPSPAEVASDSDKAAIAREDQYHAALRSAGIEWAKQHPQEYDEIRAAVDAEFSKSLGSAFGRMARDSALAQRCGVAAGFPDFDSWSREIAA
jgi:hypothetical protein